MDTLVSEIAANHQRLLKDYFRDCQAVRLVEDGPGYLLYSVIWPHMSKSVAVFVLPASVMKGKDRCILLLLGETSPYLEDVADCIAWKFADSPTLFLVQASSLRQAIVANAAKWLKDYETQHSATWVPWTVLHNAEATYR